MQEVTQDEVVRGIASLNRQKAARPHGRNNDLLKDAQALLVPVVLGIANELLKGVQPPSSFLDDLIIPLQKKIMATRMQAILGGAIGELQQGFVHGRNMLKTVMMVVAILRTAQREPETSVGESRAIVLLDFKKAYVTVVHDFLFMVMRKFGFATDFVEMIQRLHQGTTAKFLVNGELSEPIPIQTGIRQGCPLAPLLFILAAEILRIAIQADHSLQRIEIPNGQGSRHKFQHLWTIEQSFWSKPRTSRK
ncbi:Reverse transcriptase precursor [Phytophthora megakarya]|uniref:Reverse transcriptase n=1 Tax=Phytophthora megakarya TaxID=4795 RepID=A0A225UEL4_9STRA|nr:Reverse transcriptase precursor [Phytophthora megakarya]